ncbi:MAG: hypothetical protein Kow00121_43300 [Elainellaceae cyanobacterium]
MCEPKMTSIRLAKTISELKQCYPIFVQLHTDLTEADFLSTIPRLQASGYQMAYLEVNNAAKSVAGFHLGESFGWKKHLYIADLVTDQNSRSAGYGQLLLTWLKDYAKKQNCVSLHLDSKVTRHAAHKFYLNQNLIISGYHFLTEI